MENDDLELKTEFLGEVAYLLEQCQESFLKLEGDLSLKEQNQEFAQIFRAAHSIKGTGAAVGFEDLAGFAHKIEDILSILRVYPKRTNSQIITLLLEATDAMKSRVDDLTEGCESEWKIKPLQDRLLDTLQSLESGNEAPAESSPSESEDEDQFAPLAEITKESIPKTSSKTAGEAYQATSTVKVSTDRVESVLNIVGELVVIKSQIMQEDSVTNLDNPRLSALADMLDKSVRDLHERTLSMRLTSIKPLFLKLQRILRDLSMRLDRKIHVEISGEQTEIDRNMIEMLTDPLVHLVRNAIDHGIEEKEQRISANKPEEATIKISAHQTSGQIMIEVQDDGKGISRQKVFDKAVTNGLIPSSASISEFPDQDVLNLVFSPGLSTTQKVSDISGRGVGLDVVKSNLEKLKGNVSIQSEEGKGTCFSISLPLTTAITEGMVVVVQGYRFILPTFYVKELVQINECQTVESRRYRQSIRIKDEIFPILDAKVLLRFDENVRSYHRRVNEFDSSLSTYTDDDTTELVALLEANDKTYAFPIQQVLGQNQFVVKPIELFHLGNQQGVSGAAVLGDGTVALVIDVEALSREVKTVAAQSLQVPKEVAA